MERGCSGPMHCVSPPTKETRERSQWVPGKLLAIAHAGDLVMRVKRGLFKSTTGASKFVSTLDRMNMNL
eukprot:1152830-Pelagomonas_calceolata.AAC.2